MPHFLVKNVRCASLALLASLALHASAQDSRPPFIIAPTVEGILLCDEAVAQPQIRSIDEAYAYCRQRKLDGAPAVSRLLDKLEPYCDALTIQYTVSAVALNNALNAQVDVISGDFAPTGKLSLTMVSDPAVIAITEQEIDGVVREICASPNDVPGYDKDQYIDPAILANVKGGSYAYCDADGNYYRSGFGLNY